MKNLISVLALVLLAVVAALLWRLESHTAVLAELARVQLADREEFRREEQARRAAAERAQAEAKARDEAAAAQQAAAAVEAEQRAKDEATRAAKMVSPVKPGEVVPEIVLDNHTTVRDAVVVAVQATSVSFKVGARLYNIPTERLPAELRGRIRRMFPEEPAAEVGPSAQP
jgi:ATPase subunit of ABC transporter with duplicated ATPase domains